MSITSFIRDLAAFEGDKVFNPYAHVCSAHDRHDAARIRRRNLSELIKSALNGGATTIWVARDLGYRGGRRTGLALTDEAHLSRLAEVFKADKIEKATKGPLVAERTATVIWQMLARIREPVMLWNVFPFHPHEAEDPMTNRCHTRAEREAAEPFLDSLIEMLKPQKAVAIGRDAAAALDGLSIPVYCARHPSYGGQSEFIEQIETLYGLKPQQPRQRHLDLEVSPQHA